MAPQSSPLLALAAELRNKIYRLALTTQERVKIDKATFTTQKALLDTCSQIRNETREIFYSENAFLIIVDGSETVETSAKWLQTLANTAALIKGVQVMNELSEKILAGYHAEATRVSWWFRGGEEGAVSGMAEARGDADCHIMISACIDAVVGGLAFKALQLPIRPLLPHGHNPAISYKRAACLHVDVIRDCAALIAPRGRGGDPNFTEAGSAMQETSMDKIGYECGFEGTKV